MTNHRTEARNIALHFFEKIKKKDYKDLARQVVIAKKLLSEGYTEDELILIINHLTTYPPKTGELTSLMFISYVGEDILKQINSEQVKEVVKNMKMPEPNKHSKTNNNNKLSMFGQKQNTWEGWGK